MKKEKALVRSAMVFAGVLVLAIAMSSVGAAQDWNDEATPTGENLYGVETTSNGTFAVGTGGEVIQRTGSGWVLTTDTGPSGNSNELYGVDATDDGDTIWFVGLSGAVGEYDVVSGQLNDYTNPGELSTNNFNDVAVKKQSGSAAVYIAAADGKVYYTQDNGTNWNEVTPASGSEINAIDFFDDQIGHLVDANKQVYETTDGGNSWTKIGIQGAGESFLDVDSESTSDVRVTTANGSVYRYDGSSWTKTQVSENELRGIEQNGGSGYVVGGNGSVYRLSSGSYSQEGTTTTNLLRDVTLGSPNVSVGDSGTALVNTGGSGSSNSAPSAEFMYSPQSPNVSETVNFDAADSIDNDGSIQEYEWDFDGDGTTDATGLTTTNSFPGPGDYTVTLTVTDDDGATDTKTETVSVQSSGGGPSGVDQYREDPSDPTSSVRLSGLQNAIQDFINNSIDLSLLQNVIQEFIAT